MQWGMSVADPAVYFRVNSIAQAAFFKSTAPEVLISSAYGKGKSRVICEKANWLAGAFPGTKIVLARKQRAHIGGTTLRTFLEEVVHPSIIAQGWRPTADGGSTMFYPNGSEVLIVGLDNPGRARSGAYTAAYVDQCEELEEIEWDAIAGRLRHPVGPYRQLGGACNPESPSHFLFKRFRPDKGTHIQHFETPSKLPDGRVLPAGRVRRETIISGARDNYGNLPDDYLERLGAMRGRYYDRYVLGLWASYEGVLYGEVWNPNPDGHLVHRPEAWSRWGGHPPPDWPRYRSFDFGFNNPFVCQWWARDDDGVFWRYREIYMSHVTVPEHKKLIRQLEEKELDDVREAQRREGDTPIERLPFQLSVADHDAGDRAILEREPYRIITRPANKMNDAIDAAVPHVFKMLEERRIRFVIGARVERDSRLEHEDKPTCTEEEMGALHYPKPQDSVLIQAKRERPVKEDDHGHDALWYLFWTLKTKPRVEVYR